MKWRRTEERDFAIIKELHTKAGYDTEMPDLSSDKMLSSWVFVEDDVIIAWSGVQLMPEAIAILDPDWGSPHSRMRLVGTFHRPLAEDVRKAGYEKVFATIDRKYPGFGKRLIKDCGWFKAGETVWIMMKKVLGDK